MLLDDVSQHRSASAVHNEIRILFIDCSSQLACRPAGRQPVVTVGRMRTGGVTSARRASLTSLSSVEINWSRSAAVDCRPPPPPPPLLLLLLLLLLLAGLVVNELRGTGGHSPGTPTRRPASHARTHAAVTEQYCFADPLQQQQQRRRRRRRWRDDGRQLPSGPHRPTDPPTAEGRTVRRPGAGRRRRRDSRRRYICICRDDDDDDDRPNERTNGRTDGQTDGVSGRGRRVTAAAVRWTCFVARQRSRARDRHINCADNETAAAMPGTRTCLRVDSCCCCCSGCCCTRRLAEKHLVKLLYCTSHRHGVLVWPISNVSMHLHDVLPGLVCTSMPRRLNWLLTRTTVSSRTFLTILTMFCTNFSRTKLIIPAILDLVITLSVSLTAIFY